MLASLYAYTGLTRGYKEGVTLLYLAMHTYFAAQNLRFRSNLWSAFSCSCWSSYSALLSTAFVSLILARQSLFRHAHQSCAKRHSAMFSFLLLAPPTAPCWARRAQQGAVGRARSGRRVCDRARNFTYLFSLPTRFCHPGKYTLMS